MSNVPMIKFARHGEGSIGFATGRAEDNGDEAVVLYLKPTIKNVGIGELDSDVDLSEVLGDPIVGFMFYQEESIDVLIEVLKDIKVRLAAQQKG